KPPPYTPEKREKKSVTACQASPAGISLLRCPEYRKCCLNSHILARRFCPTHHSMVRILAQLSSSLSVHSPAAESGVGPNFFKAIFSLKRRFAMRISKAMGVFASLLAMLGLSSCGGGSSSGTQPSQQMGSMFTIG